MNEAHKIEGVPEGLTLIGFIKRETDTTTGPHPGVYYEAVFEPMKKHDVLIAEVDLTTNGLTNRYMNPNMKVEIRIPGYSLPTRNWRVEERDA